MYGVLTVTVSSSPVRVPLQYEYLCKTVHKRWTLLKCRNLKHQNLCHSFSSSFFVDLSWARCWWQWRRWWPLVARLCPLSPVFATIWNKTNWFVKKETLFRVWAAEQIDSALGFPSMTKAKVSTLKPINLPRHCTKFKILRLQENLGLNFICNIHLVQCYYIDDKKFRSVRQNKEPQGTPNFKTKHL